jgi:hypothetical protein
MTNTVSQTVSDEVLDSGIQIESSGNPNAKARTSSALGLAQFLNATWLATVKLHRPDVMVGRTEKQVLALRTNPSFSIEMMARHWEDNQRIVGMSATPGDLYLAHFLGVGTAKQVYRAGANTPILNIVSNAAYRANRSIFDTYNTAGRLRGWADSKMKKAGGHGWVRKYYTGTFEGGSLPATDMSAQERALPEGFHGDLQMLDVQEILAGMNYYGGELDGLWGGKTSGAISGFINDRGGFMPAPTSSAQFRQALPRLQPELDKAEKEKWTRPVKESREELDPKTVATVAPETVPAKRGFIASLWASIVAFIAAVGDTVASYATTVWNFITSNKDNIPDTATDPGFLSKTFHAVPPAAWVFLAAVLFGFVAWSAHKSLQKSREQVQNGVR